MSSLLDMRSSNVPYLVSEHPPSNFVWVSELGSEGDLVYGALLDELRPGDISPVQGDLNMWEAD